MRIEDLKQTATWVGHKDKVPKNPRTGANASTTDASTWASASAAWGAKKRHGWDGIGYVFTIGSGVVGVDLDDCFEPGPDGMRHWKPWARDVAQCLDSYTEYSPSRNGVHILARGTIPHSITKNKIGFEMYNEARYFTVTGQVIGDVHEIRERPAELLALHFTFDDEPRALPNVAPASLDAPSHDDVRAMLQALPVHMDYLDWLRVLMAVHDVYPGTDGVALIEAWSPGKRGEVAGKFRSFDRTAKEGVSIGTLVHMAKQYGHKMQRPPSPTYRSKNNQSANVSRLMAA
jgi:putative DNA primase/helicase